MKTIINPIAITMAAVIATMQITTQTAQAESNLDQQLRQIIENQGLTGDPAKAFNLPNPYEPEVELGKLLFFSQALGGEKNAACASCHHPYLGGGDGLALAVGVDAQNSAMLGEGRKHPDDIFNNPRNSPTVFNAWIWTQGVFWDSRIEKLADGGIRTPDSPFGQADLNAGDNLLMAQAGFPVTSVEEMRTENFEPGSDNQTVRAHLGSRLANTGIGAGELDKNFWRPLFEWVYGQDTPAGQDVVNFDNIRRAIASYENSQNLTNNPWFSYIKGNNNAISDSQKRGAKLFYQFPPDGGAGCAACHSGDTFTNQAAFHVGFPQIGPGKGHGTSGAEDHGRGEHTGQPQDNNAFRTPTLLNIGVTAPYGHSGAYETLEQVIDHYNDFDHVMTTFVNNKQWCQQPQFAAVTECQKLFPHATDIADGLKSQIEQLRQLGAPAMLPLQLDAEQKADLVAFLHALTDPCTQDAECLSQWLPNPVFGDPDDLQLQPINKNNLPLSVTRDCKQVTLESGLLHNNQMECVSGGMKMFYFNVKQNDTTLYISTTGGSGNVDIFYNSMVWASPMNAEKRSTGPNNEEVLVVNANRGYHYITLSSDSQFNLTGLTVSTGKAPTVDPNIPGVADACALWLPPKDYAELKNGQSECIADNGGYFTHFIQPHIKQITISTDHGSGDLSLYSGATWSSSHHYDQSSTNPNSNQESIVINNPNPGWLYITVAAENAKGMSIRLDKKSAN